MKPNQPGSMYLPRLFPFIIFAFVACSHSNHEVNAFLNRIEAVVQQHPDSALIDLVRLDSFIDVEAVSIEGDRQMARYALLKTQTHDKNWIDDTNDSLILHAVRYYDEHGSKREQMLAHFYHGAIFRNIKDYGAAFVAYRQAEKLALDLCENNYLSLIYGNLATLSYETYSKDAILYCQKGLHYARLSHNKRQAFHIMSELAQYYSARLVYDSAEYWFHQVLDSLPASDPIVQYCLTSYIEQCIINEKFLYADSLLNLLSPIVQPVDLLNKACLFHLEGRYDSANAYINRAEQAIKTPEQMVFYYEKLSWIAKMKGNLSEALSLNRKRINAQNEVITSILSQSVSDYQHSYEQQQKKIAEFQYIQYRNQSAFVGFFCLLLFILLLSYLFQLFKTRSRMLDETIVKYVDQSILMEQQKTTLGSLETQIETLQQRLKIARSTSIACKLSRLYSDRFSILDRLGIVFFKKQGQLGFKQRIYDTVEAEIKRLHSDQKTIKEIDRIIDGYFNGAMTKAKDKELRLTNTDITFLRYMMMNLSYETIAFLLDKEDVQSLYTRKKRLKQKLKQSETPQAREILESIAAINEENRSDLNIDPTI